MAGSGHRLVRGAVIGQLEAVPLARLNLQVRRPISCSWRRWSASCARKMAQGPRRSAPACLIPKLQQRTQEMSGADTRVAFTGKLADALESLSGKRGGAELDAADCSAAPRYSRSGSSTGALAARPVLAAQSDAGRALWSGRLGRCADRQDAMDCPSQNLRSVENTPGSRELGAIGNSYSNPWPGASGSVRQPEPVST